MSLRLQFLLWALHDSHSRFNIAEAFLQYRQIGSFDWPILSFLDHEPLARGRAEYPVCLCFALQTQPPGFDFSRSFSSVASIGLSFSIDLVFDRNRWHLQGHMNHSIV